MIVLVFDPGRTTGWCTMRVGALTAEITNAGQFPLMEKVQELIAALQMNAHYGLTEALILFEHYQVFSPNTDNVAMEVIGAIKAFATFYDIPIISRTSSSRTLALKRYPELDRYREKGDHSVSHWWDAVQHGLTYAYKDKGIRDLMVQIQQDI